MVMSTVFGYCRIIRQTQRVALQVRRIKAEFPDAVIYKEQFMGSILISRKAFLSLLQKVKPGDTIVFESVL